MSKLSLREIAQSQLDSTPVIDGQLIVCLDTGNAYRDTATAHVKIGSDLEVVSDLPLAPLAEKLYYLKPDKLYVFLGGNWTLLNDKTIDLDENIAKLPAGTATDLNDDVEIITQDTDFTQPHYYRRKLVVLWEYIKAKAQDFFAAKDHKHKKADITDFPTSMPASDVHPWAKEATKPSYTKDEVGLGNVDNTADADKTVKRATTAGTADSANSVTWENVKDKPTTFPAADHNHDSRYYTESEMDGKLSGKVNDTETGANGFLAKLTAWTANPTDDTYFIRQDTGGTNQFGRVKFSTIWNYIKSKADGTYQPKGSYAASSHTHDDRYYTESEMDGKLAEKLHEETITDARDLNTIKTTGVYHLKTTSYTNGPGVSNHATLFVDYTVGTPYQIFIPDSVNRAWRRNHVNSNDTWSTWTELKYTDTNTWRGIQNNLTSDSTTDSLSAAQGKALKLLVDSKAPNGHTHSFSSITDKPSTYTPSAHNQSWSTITDKPALMESGDYSAETIEALLKRIQGLSPRMGSCCLTKDTHVANTWWNFIYTPHRTGSGGDNPDYGTLLLFPMTGTGSSYIIRAGKDGAVKEVRKIYTSSDKPTKGDVGLGNVDNTADANKSVKYATSAGSASSATKATTADKATTSKSLQLLSSTRPTSMNFNLADSDYLGKITYQIASSSTTTGKPPVDSCVLNFSWDNSGWGAQVAVANSNNPRMYVRGAISNNGASKWDTSWKTVEYKENLGAAAYKNIRSLSNVGPSGWANQSTDDGYVPTMAFMAFWNGAYGGTSSNLQYCDRGRFGTIVTKSSGDYAVAGHVHNSVNDIGTNKPTTFAYSKDGMNYGDYTWLAGWNGYELRAVNKNQFAQAHSHPYLPLGGGTMSGALNFANNTWNTVGDDVQIGDHNTSGSFYIQGLNGATNIKLKKKGDTSTGSGDSATITYDGGNLIIDKTIQANLSGNASTATKATSADKATSASSADKAAKLTTARTVSGGSDITLSFNYDGSANSNASIGFYSCNHGVSNTNNYPFHRFAKLNANKGAWVDHSMTFLISQDYSGGGYGVCRLVYRSNADSSSASVVAEWLVRKGLSADTVQVAIKTDKTNGAYCDAFYKSSGTYMGATIRSIASGGRACSGRTWILIDSNEAYGTTATDKKTSSECWKTIAEAGTALHNQAYSSSASAIDGGYVASAGSANSANTATTAVKLARSGNTSYPMTFNWSGQSGQPSWLWGGNDGTNMYVYNPSNFNVNYAKSAGSVAWGNVSEKPSSYPPASHSHSYLPLSGGTMSGRIIRSGGGSWIGDRDNVAVFGNSYGQTAGYSYNPVVGQKTSSGAWTIGNLSGNESLIFNYTTDGNYNKGSNNATQVYLPAQAGTIITSATIGSQSVNYANSAGAVAWDKVSGKPSTYPPSSHTHAYLPTAGGTMSGNVSFSSIGNTNTSNKISWNGSTDGADIYYQTTASDQGNLVINLRDDSNCYLRIAKNGTFKSYFSPDDGNFHGNVNGNADTATSAGNGVTASGSNYVRFGNGTQICWGYKNENDRGGTTSFAVAFNNTSYALALTSTVKSDNAPFITGRSTTSFSYDRNGVAWDDVQWIAVGTWK